MKHGQHPGILMNQGLGHLQGQDVGGAVGYFKQSVQASSNYLPTQRLLQRLAQG